MSNKLSEKQIIWHLEHWQWHNKRSKRHVSQRPKSTLSLLQMSIKLFKEYFLDINWSKRRVWRNQKSSGSVPNADYYLRKYFCFIRQILCQLYYRGKKSFDIFHTNIDRLNYRNVVYHGNRKALCAPFINYI